MNGLVLSLFPGIGLLDRAFEEEGFCVVRGPDVIWGGDIRRFNPPAGRFGGVIGGPPCQCFSSLASIVKARGHKIRFGNLIPEFERCVAEAEPDWWLMENVPRAPLPTVPGYQVHAFLLNNRWVGGEQNRLRRFSFGSKEGVKIHPETNVFEPIRFEAAVTTSVGGRRRGPNPEGKGKQRVAIANSSKGRTLAEDLVLQGLPADFLSDAPFTLSGKKRAIGNGVPLPMGRAIARAVSEAVKEIPALEDS